MPIKDPVCGMEIDPQTAFASRQAKGQTFYFCSENCLRQFDSSPEKYIRVIPSATTGVAANASGTLRVDLSVRGLNRVGGPALSQTLQAVTGVKRVYVNAGSGRAAIEYDPSRAKTADFVDAIRAAGFNADSQTLRLKVNGLYCAECVGRIENALLATPGVLGATMNAATNEVKVDYSPSIGDLKSIDASH